MVLSLRASQSLGNRNEEGDEDEIRGSTDNPSVYGPLSCLSIRKTPDFTCSTSCGAALRQEDVELLMRLLF